MGVVAVYLNLALAGNGFLKTHILGQDPGSIITTSIYDLFV